MSASQIYLNGHIVPETEARISVRDRSYLFGEGVFESFRSFAGKIPLLAAHLKRLAWSATFLSLPYPTEVDFAEVCEELLQRNERQDARFKIVLSACDAGATAKPADTPAQLATNLLVLCDPLQPSSPNPYRLKTARTLVNDAPPISSIKSTNRLVKLLARAEAREAGFDDAILLNNKGLVTEASTGNLFWVDVSGRLKTVAEAHGLLRGVMKQELLALIRANNLVCLEGEITPEDLSNTREVFLTNSSLGIKPVGHIDHRQLSGGETGEVTRMLMELWEKELCRRVDVPTR